MGVEQGNKWRERVFAGGRDAKWEMRRENELECEDCGKVCKSKGGLTIHRRRMHEVSVKKRVFKCDECKGEFLQEANLLNHRKICDGGVAGERRLCALCGGSFSRKYVKRHMRSCAVRRGVLLPAPGEVEEDAARVYRPKRKDCDVCGRNVAATNLRRHQGTGWCRAQRA